jgi:sugar phosphate isomerase/epimerase
MIELARTYGFTGIDIDIVDFGQQVADFGLEDAKRLIEAADLRIGNFPLPVRMYEEEEWYTKDMARLPSLAELASALGCTRCAFTIQPFSDDLPFHQNFEKHAERLGKIGDILATHGVLLGLEFSASASLREGKTFEFIKDLAGLTQLLDAIGKKNVGLLVNSFQLYTAGQDPVAAVGTIPGERIISVQLADAPADVTADKLTDAHRKLPGETHVINHVEFITALKGKNYHGPVTAAPLRGRVKGMGRQRAVMECGNLLTEIFIEAGVMSRDVPALPPPETAPAPSS